MTCIGQILNITQNKPHLLQGISGDLCIEGGGSYKGYEYLITLNDMGFRCGYVAIKGTEPWVDKHYDEVPVECHGGLTFFDDHETIKSQFGITCPDKWIGFDAGHFWDAKDWESTEKYNMTTIKTRLKNAKEAHPELHMIQDLEETLRVGCDAEVKDFAYIEKECKSIIDQIESYRASHLYGERMRLCNHCGEETKNKEICDQCLDEMDELDRKD